MKSTAAALRQVRAALTTRGWCQSDYVDDRGAVCLVGAIRVTSRGPAAARVYAALVKATGAPWSQLTRWNDTPGRTEEQVIAAVDHAIADADAGRL